MKQSSKSIVSKKKCKMTTTGKHMYQKMQTILEEKDVLIFYRCLACNLIDDTKNRYETIK